MELFRRDCGNTDILWLWETLLASHRVDGNKGLLIGALVSERACQYLMSFAWRYVTGLHKARRGKPVPLVTCCVTHMDDIILTGFNRRDVLRAARMLIRYIGDTLCLEVKEGWHIHRWEDTPLDTMGYVIHDSGRMTVRPRIFLRARRATRRAARGPVSPGLAGRVMAYKGYFTPGQKHRAAARAGRYRHTDSRRVIRWMGPVWAKCAAVISEAAKKGGKHNDNRGILQREAPSGHIYAAPGEARG